MMWLQRAEGPPALRWLRYWEATLLPRDATWSERFMELR